MSTIESDIDIKIQNGKITMKAPFNSDLNEDSQGLGGRFDRFTKSWIFPERVLEPLRAALRAHFGYDDRPYSAVTVHVSLSGTYGRGSTELEYFGRTLIHRPGRDAQVRLASNVRIFKGLFEESAGSMQYPALGNVDGIVLEVRDVPSTHPELEFEEVQIIADANGEPALESLAKEEKRLLSELESVRARIAELSDQATPSQEGGAVEDTSGFKAEALHLWRKTWDAFSEELSWDGYSDDDVQKVVQQIDDAIEQGHEQEYILQAAQHAGGTFRTDLDYFLPRQ